MVGYKRHIKDVFFNYARHTKEKNVKINQKIYSYTKGADKASVL